MLNTMGNRDKDADMKISIPATRYTKQVIFKADENCAAVWFKPVGAGEFVVFGFIWRNPYGGPRGPVFVREMVRA